MKLRGRSEKGCAGRWWSPLRLVRGLIRGARGPRWLRIAWLAAMVLVLVCGICFAVLGTSGALELSPWILVGGSIVLTFPAGYFVHVGEAYAVMYLVHWLGGSDVVESAPIALRVAMSILSPAIWWLSMVAAGYFQWFWLLPRIYARVRDSLRKGFRWR